MTPIKRVKNNLNHFVCVDIKDPPNFLRFKTWEAKIKNQKKKSNDIIPKK